MLTFSSQSITGLFFSYGYFILLTGSAFCLDRCFFVDNRIIRKLLHIAMGGWWFISLAYFADPLFPVMVSLSLVVVNILFLVTDIVPGFQRGESRGIVIYPLVLAAGSYIAFASQEGRVAATAGVIALSLGDGAAGLVGQLFHKRKIFRNKTTAGFFTMFIVTFTGLGILSSCAGAGFIVIALLAAITELYSPNGLDNVTVPLLTSILYYFYLILPF
jgi:phytol kinase